MLLILHPSFSFAATAVPQHGAGAGTGEPAPLAVMHQGKARWKKDIRNPSRHILLAYPPSAQTVAEGWGRDGIRCSARAGGRASQDIAQKRNPEETAASALSEMSVWGHAVLPTKTAAHFHMSSQFWGQFSPSFPYGNSSECILSAEELQH